MDNIREKLVELLWRATEECNFDSCAACHYRESHYCLEELIADRLLANGVTVQDKRIENDTVKTNEEK